MSIRCSLFPLGLGFTTVKQLVVPTSSNKITGGVLDPATPDDIFHPDIEVLANQDDGSRIIGLFESGKVVDSTTLQLKQAHALGFHRIVDTNTGRALHDSIFRNTELHRLWREQSRTFDSTILEHTEDFIKYLKDNALARYYQGEPVDLDQLWEKTYNYNHVICLYMKAIGGPSNDSRAARLAETIIHTLQHTLNRRHMAIKGLPQAVEKLIDHIEHELIPDLTATHALIRRIYKGLPFIVGDSAVVIAA